MISPGAHWPRALRDLHWALTAPSLLNEKPFSPNPTHAHKPDHWLELAQRSQDFFDAELRNPERLQEHLRPRPCHRLGVYFEALLSYWLQHTPFYSVVLEHFPIRSEDGKSTLGEIDWLLRNESNGRLEHWECAVKFYLCARAAPLGLHECVGPGLKDRLSIKVARMRDHQLRQSAHPSVQRHLLDQTTEITATAVVKGALYYPWHERDEVQIPDGVSAAVGKRFWLREKDLREYQEAQNLLATQAHGRKAAQHIFYLPLEKKLWLAPRYARASDGVTLDQLNRLATQQSPQPLHFAVFHPKSEDPDTVWLETKRAFLVDGAWSRLLPEFISGKHPK